MKLHLALSVVQSAGLLAFVSAFVPLSSVSITSRAVPNAYIVELRSAVETNTRTAHADFYRSLHDRGVGVQIKNEYNSPNVFVGVSIVLSSAEDVATVMQTPGVEAVRPVMLVPRPRVHKHSVVKVNDPGLPDTFSPHVMTGVDKVHAEGNFGRGIKIGIIDTGIDYQHPTLGNGFGPSYKIISGYDLVGDEYTGMNTPIPDNDPLDECSGHGTHVAGIIGANPGNPFNISGVAFEASLAAYRVFGCQGSAQDNVIIEALLRAFDDGMDVINLSLGESDGWTEGSTSVVASRIAKKGRVVAIAAGNDGMYGSWYTSSPGNGIDVISVASIDNTFIPIQNATVNGVIHDPIPYLQALPLHVNGSLPIYATSNDTSSTTDACDPLPDNTPDLSRYVVLIHRGTCSFVQKLRNAANKGGKVFLIYNSDGGSFSAIGVGNYKAALISAGDGKFLVKQFNEKVPVTLTFPQTGASFPIPDVTHGGLVSSFSTYGPTNDMYFKPALAAPGGNILSTWPLKLGGYALESGTSMATPFTAAAAALILKAHGRGSAKQVRDLLQTTAASVASDLSDGSPLQTVSVQGAGLINVHHAIHTTTLVSPGQLTLNDTANFSGLKKIRIKNRGSMPVTYRLSHEAAGTALSVQQGLPFAAVGPVPLARIAAAVQFDPPLVTVQPGTTATISVHFSPPEDAEPSRYPVYSGFIHVTSPTEQLKVTYLGLAASLEEKSVLDNTETYFGPGKQLPLIFDADRNVQMAPVNYTLLGHDFPSLVYRLAFGSPSIRIDLVDKDVRFTPTLSSNMIPAAHRALNSWGHQESDVSSVKTLGNLATFKYVPRNNDDPKPENNGYSALSFKGVFANKTLARNGQYRVLLRALRANGDARKSIDYESWLSPAIVVNRPIRT